MAIELDQHQLQAALESIGEGVVIFSTEGALSYINRVALHLTGIDADELRAKDLTATTYLESLKLHYADGRDVPSAERPLARLLRGESFSNVELQVRRAEGGIEGDRVWWVSVSGHPVTDPQDNTSCLILTIRDITAQREAEKLFATAFQVSPTPTVVATLANLRLVMVNDSFVSLSDYPRAKLVGRTVAELELIVQQERLEGALAQLQEGMPVTLRDLDLRTRRGEVRHTLAAGSPIDCNQEACVLATFVDITRRRAMTEAVHRATEDLLQDTAWFSRTVGEKLTQLRAGITDTKPLPKLTTRERQVLQRIAEGDTNEEIAAALKLSHQTVRNYVHRIYKKIGVASRAEAVVWAREHRL